MNYESLSLVLKSLANPNRMKIVDVLSCGSLCACDLLEYFDFTQPTLSHHMKVLEKAGVVCVSKRAMAPLFIEGRICCRIYGIYSTITCK